MARAISIAVLLLGLGLLMLIWFLARLVRRLTFRSDKQQERRAPGGVTYWAILIAIFVLFISWTLFWTAHQLIGFKPFMPSTSIGRLEVRNMGDPIKSMKFDFYPASLTGNDSHSTPTTFYLSGNTWRLEGQYVKISGIFTYVFGWQFFYKVTDFHGDYVGHKPPGIDAPMLSHRSIEGGPADLSMVLGILSLFKDSFEFGEFAGETFSIKQRRLYNLILSDSGTLAIESIEDIRH